MVAAKPDRRGRIIQALTTNDVCLFYVEPFGNKRITDTAASRFYCRPGTEFFGNEDIAPSSKSGIAFKE